MIRPLSNFVIVRRDPNTTPPDYSVQPRLIELPDFVLAKALWGTVIAVGPRVTDLLPGDRAYLPWRWQRPFADADYGDVEILQEHEIALRVDEELMHNGHTHRSALHLKRCVEA